MMKNDLKLKFGRPEEFEENEIEIFLSLIREQTKIPNPRKDRVMSCKYIAIGYIANEAVCIGAIKKKTPSDFSPEKSNLKNLAVQFEWEIGYFYTKPSYEGNGYASKIMNELIESYGEGNLMATTEIRKGNRMISSLENRNFKQVGNEWLNSKKDANLRLFLRF